MEEYKSNSHKSRQNQNDDIPEKRVEKVVSGSVKSKKKNGSSEDYKRICSGRRR